MPKKLILTPAPFDDEALSSWLARTALRYGASPAELHDYIGLGSLDPDGSRAAAAVALLSEAANVAPEQLNAIVEYQRRFIRRPRDLLHMDPETGLRGTVCPLCLEEDVAEGRDQYVRAEWVSVWRISCRAHGCQLRDFEFVGLDEGAQAKGRTRWIGRFEEAVQPIRTRTHRPLRTAGADAPDAHLLALERLLSGLDTARHSGEPWTISASLDQLQNTVWSLVDALCSRPEGGGHVVDYFRDGEDYRRMYGGLFTPGLNVLPALQANHRAIVLSATAAILLDPRRFQLRAHHAWGEAYIFNLLDLPAERMKRLSSVSKLAAKDPLYIVFGACSTPIAEYLSEAAQKWEEPLRARAAQAAAFALAYRRR